VPGEGMFHNVTTAHAIPARTFNDSILTNTNGRWG
jgi:hypothetical protein